MGTTRTSYRPGHDPALDGVRGLAIALVLLFHLFGIGPFVHVAGIGWAGVDLFFVLSGFLITGILWDTRGRPGAIRHFLIRRVLRIFPLYYAVLAVVFLASSLLRVPAMQELLHGQVWFWTYTANWWFAMEGWPKSSHILNHFWSLAIEEQFYLVWPWVITFLRKRTIVVLALLAMLAGLAIRCARPELLLSYVSTATRLDGLLIGALLAIGLREAPQLVTRFRWPALLTGSVTLIVIIVTARSADLAVPWMVRVGYTAFALLFGGLVASLYLPGSFSTILRTCFGTRSLRWLGKYAYGIYVYHNILYWTMFGWLGWDRFWRGRAGEDLIHLGVMLAFTALCLAISWASYHLFEKRFLDLKDKWAPSGGQA